MHWIAHVHGGPQRVNHSAVSVGHKVFSFGGYCSVEDYHIAKPMDVHILNTVTLKWHVYYPPRGCQDDVPFLRYGHTAVAHGTKVYIWGGRNDELACNKLFCFDTDLLKWSYIETRGRSPDPRDGHSACVINDHMYIFGGFEDWGNQFSQEVYKLNLHTFVWIKVISKGEPPSYRDFHTATAISNRMYVFGGRGDEMAPLHTQTEIYSNNIVYLDIATNCWHTPTVCGDPPTGRRSHSAFVYDDQIYIFGGYNSLLDMHFNDLHRFNPETLCWQEIKAGGEIPAKRRRQSCVVVDSRMYLFGGTSPIAPNLCNVVEHDDDDDINEFEPRPRLNDHNDLHILDFNPTLRTLCLIAVLDYKLDYYGIPKSIQLDLNIMATNNVTIERIPSTG